MIKVSKVLCKIYKITKGFIWNLRKGIIKISIKGEQFSADQKADSSITHNFLKLLKEKGICPSKNTLQMKVPSKTLAFAIEKSAERYKIRNDYFTLLFCSIAAGTNRLLLTDYYSFK